MFDVNRLFFFPEALSEFPWKQLCVVRHFTLFLEQNEPITRRPLWTRQTSSLRFLCNLSWTLWMFRANPGLQACCISQWVSVLKVCVLVRLAVIWHAFTCEGLPAALPFSLLDLFPAAIVPLSAAVLLLFLSYWDDLWHWHTVTHTWPWTHTGTHSPSVAHWTFWRLIGRLTLGSFFKRWDAAILKFYLKTDTTSGGFSHYQSISLLLSDCDLLVHTK